MMIGFGSAVSPSFAGLADAGDVQDLPLEYYAVELPDGVPDLGLDRSLNAFEGEGRPLEIDASQQARDSDEVDSFDTEATESTDSPAHELEADESADVWQSEAERRSAEDGPGCRQEPREPAQPPQEQATTAEPDLAHPDQFWAEVVRLQTRLLGDPALAPHALETAIAWVASGASLQGMKSSSPTHAGATSSSATSSSAGSKSSSAPPPSLTERAVAALSVAWEQRGSALRAVVGGKG